MPKDTAIGSFFIEFSKFEMSSVSAALHSLSRDPAFVENAEKLLNLEARLKLLERMAFVRRVPTPVIKELKTVLSRARKLQAHRDEVAANLTDANEWLPAIARVEEYAAEAIELQKAVGGIAQKFDLQPGEQAH